jgi:hypothetical protein
MHDAAGVTRAAERVTLACRALSAAATDLHVAYIRCGLTAVDKAADSLEAETERVCEMADEVANLAANLRQWAPTEAADQPAEAAARN